jgi:hypothetical protein
MWRDQCHVLGRSYFSHVSFELLSKCSEDVIMNMETRHAMDRLSASLVALTNHVEAGRVVLGIPNQPAHSGLANLRSEEDSRTKWRRVDDVTAGGRIRRE